ncbi:uncharacterized protein EI90DRAFT_3130754 [Cantharellus anzutake]|uniref:uncharacterized protein n=1 Tax=Cantharellus anzutake TaxID=1750568 RepID=UPI0019045D9B|nr:uncharacterized protein EI90DRAFT_3130754 [Cantharellus anzutake]KAF8322838.1 hypothetical protein EI90DRAFT_3130754 [Cantharellus anzutake]
MHACTTPYRALSPRRYTWTLSTPGRSLTATHLRPQHLWTSTIIPPPPWTPCSKEMGLLIVDESQLVIPSPFLPPVPPHSYLTSGLDNLIVLSFDIFYNPNLLDYNFQAPDLSGRLFSFPSYNINSLQPSNNLFQDVYRIPLVCHSQEPSNRHSQRRLGITPNESHDERLTLANASSIKYSPDKWGQRERTGHSAPFRVTEAESLQHPITLGAPPHLCVAWIAIDLSSSRKDVHDRKPNTVQCDPPYRQSTTLFGVFQTTLSPQSTAQHTDGIQSDEPPFLSDDNEPSDVPFSAALAHTLTGEIPEGHLLQLGMKSIQPQPTLANELDNNFPEEDANDMGSNSLLGDGSSDDDYNGSLAEAVISIQSRPPLRAPGTPKLIPEPYFPSVTFPLPTPKRLSHLRLRHHLWSDSGTFQVQPQPQHLPDKHATPMLPTPDLCSGIPVASLSPEPPVLAPTLDFDPTSAYTHCSG